jgi:hypothetical protein
MNIYFRGKAVGKIVGDTYKSSIEYTDRDNDKQKFLKAKSYELKNQEVKQW